MRFLFYILLYLPCIQKTGKREKKKKKMLVNRENGTVQGVGDPRSFMEAIVGEIN